MKFSDKIKGNDVDFTDINQLFNRTRTKSLENENYDDFLAIMQHFCLIPSNENGKKIWKKMREALDEINGLGKDGKSFIYFLIHFLFLIRKVTEPE